MPNPPLEGRNGEIFRKWAVFRWNQERIAAEYGISQERVSAIIRAAREKGAPDRASLLAQSAETLAELHARQMALAEQIKDGAPVAVGKDGKKLYENDGTPVRDYSGYLKALAEVRATDAEIAKRMGLNAPDRAVVEQTIKYEVVDVDSKDLT